MGLKELETDIENAVNCDSQIDDGDQVLQKMKAEHRCILSKNKYKIGDTIFTVYGCVPENCTDEQIKAQTKRKIERLILNAADEMMR